nr:reverse transcriptase domain-containing protein [Tanacetum cinerariifolium]
MSTQAETIPTPPTPIVQNIVWKRNKQTLENPNRPVSDATHREYCDKHYYRLLPLIAEKVHQEKTQQGKLKEVKARLNFERCSRRSSKIQKVSQHSESRRPNLKDEHGRRRRSRRYRSRSKSPEPTLGVFFRTRHDGSESPRHRDSEKEEMFTRVARHRVTQSFSLDPEISFSPLGDEDGTEGPMIIEAEIGGPKAQPFANTRVTEERIKVAIHPEYPKQTIAIGSTLTENGQKELCGLLRRLLDIFAWKPMDMTGVPRHIAEHQLNVHEGCPPVKQKKNSQAPKRNKAIQEEVEGLVEADIMKKVHYHNWLENSTKHSKSKLQKLGGINERFGNQKPHKIRNNKGYRRNIQDPKKNKHEVKSQEMHLCGGRGHVPGIHDVQRLNGKLASLNKFLDKSAEKSLPFFKTLKKCTKKSDFQWTTEAEAAFKQMKKLIVELPTLTAPMEKEELVVYLAAATKVVSAILMTKREAKQIPIYFVSHALQGPEINYTLVEKLVVALVHANKRLKRKIAKIEHRAGEYDIHYRPKVSIKGQILADFIVGQPEDDSPAALIEVEEELQDPWTLFTDISSCVDGSGVGLILKNTEGT